VDSRADAVDITAVDIPAVVWLQSPAAARAARHALERLRLPTGLADDVVQEAAIRAWRQAATHDDAPEHPEAVARRAIHHAATDLYRRARRRVVETDLDDVTDPPGHQPPEMSLPGALEDGCRRATQARLARRPWVGAAVLNELTFRLHPDVPIPDGAPAPDAGTDDHRTSWAALWLAGRTECFPGDGGSDDAATRQRRSRSLAAAAAELRLAVEKAVAEGER